MINVYLIHAAIWAQFAASHGANMITNFQAARQAPAAVQEKVVIRETTLSEKLELDIDSIVRPNKEIAAVQEEASRFVSSIDVLANAKGPSRETPTMHQEQRFRTDFDKKFEFRWDDDNGYSFGREYHQPCEPSDTRIYHFFVGFPFPR